MTTSVALAMVASAGCPRRFSDPDKNSKNVVDF